MKPVQIYRYKIKPAIEALLMYQAAMNFTCRYAFRRTDAKYITYSTPESEPTSAISSFFMSYKTTATVFFY
jgi:hypothetical protein